MAKISTYDKFSHLVDLERAFKVNDALAAFGIDLDTRARGEHNKRTAQGMFFVAVDQLTYTEQQAYGKLRPLLIANGVF